MSCCSSGNIEYVINKFYFRKKHCTFYYQLFDCINLRILLSVLEKIIICEILFTAGYKVNIILCSNVI